MFHPDIFKMTMCQRGEANGAKCSRGIFCAFAHNYEDSRKTASSYRKIEKTVSYSPANQPSPTIQLSPTIPPYVIAKTSVNNAVINTVSKAVINIAKVDDSVLASDFSSIVEYADYGQPVRRRGPSEPVSKESLEVAHSPSSSQHNSSQNIIVSDVTDKESLEKASNSDYLSNDYMSGSSGFNGNGLMRNNGGPPISQNNYFTPSPTLSSFSQPPPLMLAPAPGLQKSFQSTDLMQPGLRQPIQQPIQQPILQPASPQLTGSPDNNQGFQQRIARRRGPNGPVDTHFLGLLGSPLASSRLLIPDLEYFSSPNIDDFASLNEKVSSLQSDLEDQGREFAVVCRRLNEVQNELNSSKEMYLTVCSANESMALEIKSLKGDLASTQSLLYHKDQQSFSRTISKDREGCVSPLSNMILGDPSASNFFPEMQNMRAKLSSVESDFESRSIKMTFKI